MREDSTTIVIQVQPGASQNKITGFENGVWHLRIAAPPVKGKANRELIKFLSGILGVGRNKLTIERGLTGRRKVIAIRDIRQDQVVDTLKSKAGIE